jgi:hypothetical protein
MPDLGLFVVLGALGLKELLKGSLREIAGLARWLVYLLLALAGLFVAVRFVKRRFVAA